MKYGITGNGRVLLELIFLTCGGNELAEAENRAYCGVGCVTYDLLLVRTELLVSNLQLFGRLLLFGDNCLLISVQLTKILLLILELVGYMANLLLVLVGEVPILLDAQVVHFDHLMGMIKFALRLNA